MANPTRATPARRVQYAALPYRRNRAARTEVLLVTSRETGRWIIPKGWPIKRKAPHVAAAREAREEAGVVGKISRRPIGWFSYEKRLKSGRMIVCKVHVFALKVKRQEESWPEKGQRDVQWMSRTKAAKTVGDPTLADIIRTLPKRP
jgi:8-oxo-dGTP pyrophosphatase MutT (NUDIX family)